MCGICGILRFGERPITDTLLIKKMTESLIHRGPDETGMYVEGPVSLGHRRLSIIDIASGQQPMAYRSHGNLQVVVYNGEIYNHDALRRELEAFGHVFGTSSDTEVLLAAYAQWSYACLEHFRGMFAFGIWDESRKVLFIGRDRMGIKPLYYCLKEKSFIFASEIRAILASSTNGHIDVTTLDAFLTQGYVPCPRTLFKDILKLMPGEAMTITGNGETRSWFYWNFDKVGLADFDFECAKYQLEELLLESVQMRLMSEVPLGVFLSGGLDSSAITAMMCHISTQKVKTFSVGYEGHEQASELPFARKVAKLFETEHHEFILKPYDFIESIPDMVMMSEEPIVETPAIPLFQISKAAKPHATVLLSGEGSDEIFGGYGLYRKMLQIEKGFPLLKLLKRVPKKLIPGDKIKKYLDWFSTPLTDRYRGTSADVTNSIRKCLYTPSFMCHVDEEYYLQEIFHKWFTDVHEQDTLSQLLYVDSKTWLPDCLLLKADKMTMATSVELRVPFLDHKIVEFACSLPSSYKIHKGETKFILKKIMEKYLPKEIIYRKKMGFTVPTQQWFAGDLLEAAKDIVFSNKIMNTGWFQKKYLVKMFERHRNGNEDYSRRIFSLLVLYYWLDIFGITA